MHQSYRLSVSSARSLCRQPRSQIHVRFVAAGRARMLQFVDKSRAKAASAASGAPGRNRSVASSASAVSQPTQRGLANPPYTRLQQARGNADTRWDQASRRTFSFGNGEQDTSLGAAVMPAVLGTTQIGLPVNVIDALLLHFWASAS